MTYKLKLALALVASLTALPALAQQDVTVRNADTAAAATVRYWTPERMAAAKSHMPIAASIAHQIPSVGTAGTPGVAGGTVEQELPASALDELKNGSVVPTDGSFPRPHTTWGLIPGLAGKPANTTFPWSTNGELFFTEPGGDFVCTATATYGGAALNVVWTAGHCVSDGAGHFFTNWLFCPGWNKGSVNAALGCWGWSFATTTFNWFAHGAFSKDFAAVGLQHTGTVLSEDVVSAVGGLGFAWNWGRDQNWWHMGYPANAPFGRQYLVVTNAEHGYDVTTDSFGPPVNSWGSSQTFGSSGSALRLFFDLGGGGYINSNVSFLFTDQEGQELQGPYYDSNACGLWKGATGWGGGC